MSSSAYQCASSIAEFNCLPNDFQTIVDDGSSSVSRSVRNAVATFEYHQQRQLETSAPSPTARSGSRMAARSISVSSSSNVARLKAAHQRNASDDFTPRGTLLQNVISLGNEEESTRLDYGQEQSMGGRSVARLREALQRSAGLKNLEGEHQECAENQGHRRLQEFHESTFRPLDELKASLKQSTENIAVESIRTKESRRDLSPGTCFELMPPEKTIPTRNSKSPMRKPCPKVLPKPNMKRPPIPRNEVKAARRKSVGSDCTQSEDLSPDTGIATEQRKTMLTDDSLSENLADFHIGNSSDTSVWPKVEAVTSSPSLAKDPAGQAECFGEFLLGTPENLEDITRTPASARDRFVSRRCSSRSQTSQDSSRASSNISAFSSSANVESSIDEDPFHLSQADSGINMYESSYEESPLSGDLPNVELNIEFDSPASGKLHRSQVSAMLTSTYGQSSDDLSQIICDWATYKTALDYVRDSFSDISGVQRYHTNLSSLFCHGAACRIQYLSLEALTEAVHQKISEKRNELLCAKAAVDVDSIAMKHLETKVSKAIKSKAGDSRKYEKFLVSYNELDKVTQLLLILSSRLARIDNSASRLIMQSSANDSQMASLISRRDEVLQKLDDARLLKMDIDRRSKVLSTALVASLDCGEFVELNQLVAQRCRLSLQLHEITDWMRLVDDHLGMLSIKRRSSSLRGSVSVC